MKHQLDIAGVVGVSVDTFIAVGEVELQFISG